MKNGKANTEGMGKLGDFVGKVGQMLWPTLKVAFERSEFDFAKFDTTEKVRSALRKGFLDKEKNRKPDLGLNIGKVTKEDLAKLSGYDLRDLYELFYLQRFGLHVSFPDELMPEAEDRFAWPICILGIMSNEAAYCSGKSDMPKRKYTDKPLDSIMQLDRGRDAWMHGYIVRTPADFEAGEKLKNISARVIDEQKTNVLMFRERWILGEFIWWLTGLHLDRNVVTLTGSFNSDGNAISANLSVDGAHVFRCNPDDASGNLRFREAVS